MVAVSGALAALTSIPTVSFIPPAHQNLSSNIMIVWWCDLCRQLCYSLLTRQRHYCAVQPTQVAHYSATIQRTQFAGTEWEEVQVVSLYRTVYGPESYRPELPRSARY